MSTPRSFSLFELVSSVRRCIEATFSERYWIRAESSDVRIASGSGHCYLELLEKDERHNLKAKVRANIWRNTLSLITQRLKEAGLPSLSSGMEILCLVQVQYHEQYGLSLIIHDIDPNYSLGEIARLRQATIARLTKEGVINNNKALPLPRPLQRLAIISSSTAAGLEDFLDQLQGNPYGLYFHTALYEAQMQGNNTTESIITALNGVAEHLSSYDAVVIIRGGGAVSALRAFDDYELCFYCTQFPLPIIVGIGHERDVSVLDMVAHTSLKTPTAVAEYLIRTALYELSFIEQLTDRIQRAVSLYQLERMRRLSELHLRIPSVATIAIQREQVSLSQRRERLITSARMRIEQSRRQIESAAALLPYQVRSLQARRQQQLESIQGRLLSPLRQHRERYQTTLARLEQAINLAHPDKILNRGFALISHAGKIVTQAGTLHSGDRVQIRLGNDQVDATVD